MVKLTIHNTENNFRLTRGMAIDLVQLLRPHCYYNDHSLAIKIDLQILAVLRFFSEGMIQKTIASDFNHVMSQPSFSRSLDRVLNALDRIKNDFIKFPSTREERQSTSMG